jgi:tryptophan 2,3-dioxygenase
MWTRRGKCAFRGFNDRKRGVAMREVRFGWLALALTLAGCGGGGNGGGGNPPPANRAPSFTSAPAASVVENSTGTVYTATATALAAMKRILTILKTVVSQVDVLETMTPLAFGSFRGRLERASGFQSAQFRELEAVLGRRDEGILADHPPGPARDRIATAMERPGLYDSFLAYVGLTGRPAEAVQNGLVELYRTDPARAQVCERMVDIDEGIQEWRYRHVKMVERIIGAKIGTGGSAGAEYLRATLFRPFFPDLWEIRSRV